MYVSPTAAGEGLGDGLGDGEGGAGNGFTGDGTGLAGALTSVAAGAVGVGAAPPTEPQARMNTVPAIKQWTVQRMFGRAIFLNIVGEPYALADGYATVFRTFGAES